MKIKYWLDSGANAFSCYLGEFDTSEAGYTDEEWLALDEYQKEEVALEYAWNHVDWGFSEE